MLEPMVIVTDCCGCIMGKVYTSRGDANIAADAAHAHGWDAHVEMRDPEAFIAKCGEVLIVEECEYHANQ